MNSSIPQVLKKIGTFLLLFLLIILLIGGYFIWPVYEQALDNKSSKLSDNQTFLNNYDLRNKTGFTTTFSPEYFEEVLKNDPQFNNGKTIQENTLEAMRITIEDLEIKGVRIGIRWNKTSEENGDINLDYYWPYLDYLVNKKVDINLNVGVKVVRYPEIHIDEELIKEANLGVGGTLELDNPLAQKSLKHVDQVLKAIKSRYDEDQLKSFKIFNINNESTNPFGDLQWIMATDYMYEMAKIVRAEFPNGIIDLTDPMIPISLDQAKAGKSTLKDLKPLAEKLSKDNFKVRLDVNYYHFANPHPQMPWILGGEMLDTISLGKVLTLNRNFWNDCVNWAKSLNIEVGVSELQMEPWGNFDKPGRDAREFRFVLSRIYENVLDKNSTNKSSIGIWGIELFTLKLMNNNQDKDILEIRDLIKEVN